jgi:hypothetical protein
MLRFTYYLGTDERWQFAIRIHPTQKRHELNPLLWISFCQWDERVYPEGGTNGQTYLLFAVTEFSFGEFVFFAYFRDVTRLEKPAPNQLLQLLRLADYYGFEELVEQVQITFDVCRSYTCLTAQTALDLLNTVQPLQLEFKEDLEHIALTFSAFNFKDVAVLPAFRELPEDSEIYENIEEYVARAVWDKKMFVKYKSRVEKQESRSHSES